MAKAGKALPIPPLACPLGDEECGLLNDALSSCNSLECYLQKLTDIGLDVCAWRAQNDANQALATGLKAVHFPDHS